MATRYYQRRKYQYNPLVNLPHSPLRQRVPAGYLARLDELSHNVEVYVPTAFANQSDFEAAVRRAARALTPQVVNIFPTLGSDWSGEPAVFFMVILADSAARRDQLSNITNKVSQAVVQKVQPLERWGVLPYFNFRSQSEQAKLNQPALA